MVIFGASGDLTRRKLLPALYNLRKAGLLSDHFAVIGAARSGMTDDEFRRQAKEDLLGCDDGHSDPVVVDWVVLRLHYLTLDASSPEAYGELGARIAAVDKDHGTGGNVLYYLATAPNLFAPIVRQLGDAGLTGEEDDRWRRVVVEKPFGHDLESARALNRELLAVLDERQLYRIDHYLGKETVQNILAFRFGNGIFEPIWNRRYIDHVQITASETVGVEGRGGYYDGSGALRDMVPNHLFQLITLVSMEPPISFGSSAVRDEQSKVLHAIQPFGGEDVLRRTVRGQYGPGTVKGAKQPGYRARGQGASRLQHRDVRGAGAVHRQLALGRRPVLPPHGEDAAETGDGGDDPVQAPAVRAVSRHARRDARAQSAGDSHPAGRRHLRSASARRSPGRSCASGTST